MAKRKKEARAWTAEEVKEQFLDHLRGLVPYWAKVEGRTVEEKLSGLLHSVLCIFDGVTADLPSMNISLAPHEDDKAFCIDEGENWYESDMVFNDGGYLHEEWYKQPQRTPREG